MIAISLLLLYLAVAKKFEPLLLVTIGFGGLLSNIPGVEIATGDGLLHLIYMIKLKLGLSADFYGGGRHDRFWSCTRELKHLC